MGLVGSGRSNSICLVFVVILKEHAVGVEDGIWLEDGVPVGRNDGTALVVGREVVVTNCVLVQSKDKVIPREITSTPTRSKTKASRIFVRLCFHQGS